MFPPARTKRTFPRVIPLVNQIEYFAQLLEAAMCGVAVHVIIHRKVRYVYLDSDEESDLTASSLGRLSLVCVGKEKEKETASGRVAKENYETQLQDCK